MWGREGGRSWVDVGLWVLEVRRERERKGGVLNDE